MIKQYYKEIAIVITIKLIALSVLWYVCFSHPVQKEEIIQTLKQVIA